MWVVYNQTNYGSGVYFDSLYRHEGQAKARVKELEKSPDYDKDEDSWNYEFVPTFKGEPWCE